MKTYQVTYIISSQVTSEQADVVRKNLETFIQEKGGVILKSEKTTPQMLSYPIKKQRSGFFCTVEFQTTETSVKAIKEMVQKNTDILRHFMVVKKPLKIMKERRTRKPLHLAQPEHISDSVFTSEAKGKIKEKIELVDIDKKLDEILSE